MNRLQKKCIIASVTLHALLVLALIFGAALMPKEKSNTPPIITMYDSRMVTDNLTSGGQQAAVTPPPPPAPTPPQPQPETPQQPTPPPRANTRPTQPVRDNQPQPNPNLRPAELRLTQRNDNPRPTTRPNQPDAQAQARAQQEAANRQRIQSRIDQSLRTLGDNLSSSTKVEISGPSPGALMVNYGDLVGNKYRAAWNPPASLDDDNATVTVSVVIYRDGRVKSHEIIKRSGNAGMDKSIEATLQNVTFIDAFPAESRDLERKFIIKFNLAAKRATG